LKKGWKVYNRNLEARHHVSSNPFTYKTLPTPSQEMLLHKAQLIAADVRDMHFPEAG